MSMIIPTISFAVTGI